MRRALAICLLCALPSGALAQEDDRSYLTAFLEDNLSSAGRQVTITGFAGALSSRATIDRMTIADDAGIWITLTGLTLDWSRSALLSGELTVDQLTADSITIDRVPKVADSGLPSPETTPFALPELPVSVNIGQVAATEIILGEDVFGQAITARLDASANLADGAGAAEILLERTDGVTGTIILDASFSNTTRDLALDILAEEAPDGIAATLLNLPGRPSARLTISGTGTPEDFSARLDLQTDAIQRLAGTFSLRQQDNRTQVFAADVAGNLAPLFLPDYAEFFGDAVTLNIVGEADASGYVILDEFAMTTRALSLNGEMAFAPDGLPTRINVAGTLGLSDGTPVLLPLADAVETRLDRATLTLGFDAAEGESWSTSMQIDGLARSDVAIEKLALTGSGRIARIAAGRSFGATFDYIADGIRPTDPALATALGPAVAGQAIVHWKDGADAVSIPRLTIAGQGYDAAASAEIAGLETGLATTGQLRLQARDISRLSGLAGQPLRGAGTVTADGSFVPLSGAFDGKVGFTGTDLSLGIAEIDRLLRGTSTIAADVVRNETGVTLRALRLQAASLTADLSGTLATLGSDLRATVAFRDLGALGDTYAGQLNADATFRGTAERGRLTVEGTGEGIGIGVPAVDNLLGGTSQISAVGDLRDRGFDLFDLRVSAANLVVSASGRIDPLGHDLKADLQFPDLSVLGAGFRGGLMTAATFVGTLNDGQITLDGQARDIGLGQVEVDRLLAGTSTVSATLKVTDGLIQIDRARLQNPQVTGTATGTVTGSARDVAVDVRLADLALLLPEFPGVLTVTGTVAQSTARTQLDLRAQGPGGISATITGQMDPDYRRAALAIAGQAQAGLLNAFIDPGILSGSLGFDIAVNGPLLLSSVSGQVSLEGGRYTSADLPFVLEGLVGRAQIAGGRAAIDARGVLSTGGQMTVQGSVGTAAPYPADLDVVLSGFVLRDPQLYQTRGNATITLQGPLTGGAIIGGRIALVETEIRVPSGGFAASGDLPGLMHANEPGDVRQTRAYAGLLGDGSAGGVAGARGGGQAFGVDLEISAPNRVFIRGRGLDAELGGALRLQGSTANLVPSGAFELIRGRLDILGKRLTLSEATLRLEGNFVPFVRILASNESDGITSSVLIEGSVDAPDVSFVSNPELPEEEVLSRLLFGRGLDTLSAFQAVQLAGAVQTLAGRGGEGLVAKLRRGFGLDDLDISTADDGTTSLTAGKYISQNTYTEVEVDQAGRSEISLNLDITDNLTLRGQVDSEGETGIGIFLEKDY
jgi:translocation and assembly module TamB